MHGCELGVIGCTVLVVDVLLLMVRCNTEHFRALHHSDSLRLRYEACQIVLDVFCVSVIFDDHNI